MTLKGPFIVVSGPSGVGKTLFIEKSLKTFSKLSSIVSWTTRKPRPNEKNGDFYHFITKKDFEELRKTGEFVEWAQVHNEFYATSKKEVEKIWKNGQAIIKDIDVQGCRSIKKVFPHSVSVFIYPPSIQELKNRILKRGSLNEKQIKIRLQRAIEEIAEGREYDFQITNDIFQDSWNEFYDILVKNLSS